MRTPVAFALLGALAVVVAAYVYLQTHGQDGNALFLALVPLLGVAGLGVHQDMRLRAQDTTLAKIDGQTNGVLTQRIETGAEKAVENVLRRLGHNIPPRPDSEV